VFVVFLAAKRIVRFIDHSEVFILLLVARREVRFTVVLLFSEGGSVVNLGYNVDGR